MAEREGTSHGGVVCGMSQSGREEKRGWDELGRWEGEKEGEMLCAAENKRVGEGKRRLFASLVIASLSFRAL